MKAKQMYDKFKMSLPNKIYRVFVFHWYPPKKLKYGKPRLGKSTLT